MSSKFNHRRKNRARKPGRPCADYHWIGGRTRCKGHEHCLRCSQNRTHAVTRQAQAVSP